MSELIRFAVREGTKMRCVLALSEGTVELEWPVPLTESDFAAILDSLDRIRSQIAFHRAEQIDPPKKGGGK